MLNKSDYLTSPSTRLAQVLSELLDVNQALSHQGFVEKIGRLIDFSRAMALADTLNNSVSKGSQVDSAPYFEQMQTVFVDAHKRMVSFISQTFTASHQDLPFRLPQATDHSFSQEDGGLSSYQRFYELHQSEMDIGVGRLLKDIRQSLSACSPKLARLVELDMALNTVLAPYSRKLLSAVPRLLAKRFRQLYTSPFIDGGDIDTSLFVTEMRTVLLAELDIRLQPALGLMEALSIEQENTAL